AKTRDQDGDGQALLRLLTCSRTWTLRWTRQIQDCGPAVGQPGVNSARPVCIELHEPNCESCQDRQLDADDDENPRSGHSALTTLQRVGRNFVSDSAAGASIR